MKALLAFYQGKFNTVNFESQPSGKYRVTVVDRVNSLAGDFMATYDSTGVMIDYEGDSGMKSSKSTVIPTPPVAPSV